jgi:hypothetical protein
MKTLYIIRGIPGSGKSTLAATLVPNPKHRAEADMFMVDSTGAYQFNPERLSACHKACYQRIESHMKNGVSPLAVSNTSLQDRDVTHYSELARMHGYTPFVVKCENEFGSVHNVPEEAMVHFREASLAARCFTTPPPAPRHYLLHSDVGTWRVDYWDGTKWRDHPEKVHYYWMYAR